MSAYAHIIRPQETVRGFELDMRVSDKVGQELRDEILASVEHTQKFIVTKLPNVLRVTQEQFASLAEYTEEMYHTTDRMFITPLNVMEVEIDRDYKTVEAIEASMQEVDGWNEQ